MPLTFDQIVVLVVLLLVIIFLYSELLRAATTFFLAAVVFGAFGILEPTEILRGFANEQVAVIILLLIISDVIRRSEVLDYIFDRLFSRLRGYKQFLMGMMFSVSGASAFLNNTPIVALLTPYVYEWGRKKNIAPSRILIPLSYAAILGGTITLIGTSTNLIVNGMVIENELPALGMFDFTYVGLPLAIIGILYLSLWGYRLLPERRDVVEQFKEKSREYLVETTIEEGSPLVGQTIEKAGLRHLEGLFLAEIMRGEKQITPVPPTTKLKEGDVLIFAGEVGKITELMKGSKGLSMPKGVKEVGEEDKFELAEVVVARNSGFIQEKLQDTNFRGKYDASVVAIHRGGVKLTGKLGNIQLRAGDVLLVKAGGDFWQRIEENPGLYLISKINPSPQVSFSTAFVLIAGLFSAVMLSVFNIVSLFVALVILLGIILVLRIVPLPEMRREFDLNLLIIIVFALALGKAMMKTGTAELLANNAVEVFSFLGPLGILFGMYLITNVMTELMTNVAAASITFPIALSSARSLGMPEEPFILVVAYAASACFMTPVGYQTNLMVFGPGGYTFGDFLKVGFPLTLIYMVLTIGLLGYKYNLF